MIYTITLNPSVDYIVHVPSFKVNALNRTDDEHILAGGKGINVSTVLHHLGQETTALGFTAGFTGLEIERLLNVEGINTDFVYKNDGMSRINVKMSSDGETEINGRGPAISKEDMAAFFSKLDQLKDGDVLVISGSVPSGVSEDIYEKILGRLSAKKILAVVDAEKKLLKGVLRYHPFLIKPNLRELAAFFNVDRVEPEDVEEYAKKLQEHGAENVLISMGADGAVLLSKEKKLYRSCAPAGKAVNTIGAGDSMVAGFIAGYLSSGDYEKAFHTGIAAGSASAFSMELASSDEIDAVYTKMIEDGLWQR